MPSDRALHELSLQPLGLTHQKELLLRLLDTTLVKHGFPLPASDIDALRTLATNPLEHTYIRAIATYFYGCGVFRLDEMSKNRESLFNDWKRSLYVGEEEEDQNSQQDDDEAHAQGAKKKKQKKTKTKGKMSKAEVLALPPLTGSIEQVELNQFMCHNFLSVDFCPKINFVIGHNGSGKSAILTGIMVCLGGKAKVTDRANSLKSLVMEGKNAGSVSVSIHNKGPDAFKPEIYGQTIIVERTIANNGTGSYKIKDADGNIQARRKEDLTALLDHMSIAIDNPLSILTQDTSRQFLANSTPKDKYTFFSRGTLLAQLSEDHDYINSCLLQATDGFQRRTALIPDLKKDFEAAKALWKEVQKFENLENDIANVRKRLTWAMVEEKEAELESEKTRLATLKRKVADRAKTIAIADEKMELFQGRETNVRSLLETFATQGEPINLRLRECQAAFNEQRGEQERFDKEQNSAESMLRSATRSRDKMQERVDLEARKLGGVDREERERKVAQIERLKEEKREAGENVTAITEDLERLESEKSTLDSTVRHLLQTVNRARQSVDEETRIRQQLENSSYDRLGAYGNNMQTVMRALNATRWTSHAPIGPLGMYVELKRPEFRNTIEAVLGPLLKSFVVGNVQDRATLQGIFRQHRCDRQHQILLQDHKMIDYSHGEPSPGTLTFLRVMTFSNEVAKRQLIINRQIEKRALVQTKQEGDQIATSGTNRSMPPNVLTVYTVDNVQIGGHGGGFQTRAGDVRRSGLPLLGVDKAQEIEDRNKNVKRLQEELNAANREHAVAERELHALDARIRTLQGNRRKAMQTTSRLDLNMKKLQDDLVEEEPVQISMFEDLKRGAEEEMDLHQKQVNGIIESKTKIQDELNIKRVEMDELKRSLDTIKRDHDREMQRLSEIEEEIQRIERDRQEAVDRHRELTDKAGDMQTKIDGLEAEVAEQTAKAMEITDGERVATRGEAVDRIAHVLRQKEAVLAEGLKSTGTKEQVAANLHEKKDIYQEALQEKDAVESLLQELQLSVTGRMDDWKVLQTKITKRARNTFTMLMDKRGFHAKLIVDHKKQTLDLQVDVHNLGASQAKNKDKDPKTLSGGEKSFSTVCLLLSLWESMGNPFRALDEFDVFMDAVNRKISMQNMISYARSGDPPCQYIFITPQDMSHVPNMNASDMRVHRMRDPDRGQQRLNFRPVGEEDA
ncbi:Structural maintenance of chromosomes protein 6 [Podochytrium sp. JEL0797]|nr:Structural maintenance of chromosomes protein 6 [Podochytrium sp. JEL0797]